MKLPTLVGPAVALAVVATVASAQTRFPLDRATPVELGHPVNLSWSGLQQHLPPEVNPWLVFVLGFTPATVALPPSISTLPLELLPDPGVDPVINFAPPAAGTMSPWSIPSNPFFLGLVLQIQAGTLPAPSGPLVEQLSNRVAAQICHDSTIDPNLPLALPSEAQVGRSYSSLVRIPGVGGGVSNYMVAGGASPNPTTPLASTEKFDVRTLEFSVGPNMVTPRFMAETVELLDGRTLILGGIDAASNAISACEVYDPALGQFVAVGSMARARLLHSAVLLQNGEVLVVGGTTTLVANPDLTVPLTNTTNTAEIFSPVTNTWRSAAPMPRALWSPGLTRLPDGRVLLSGGMRVNFLFGLPLPVGTVADCSLYDSNTNQWSATGSMSTDRAMHSGQSAVLLSGQVLVAGGVQINVLANSLATTGGTERYNPATGSWTGAGTLPGSTSSSGTMTVLPSGDVLLVGGVSGNSTIGTVNLPSIDDVRLYSLGASTWQAKPSLLQPRGLHVAFTTEPDGQYCVASGLTQTLLGVKSVETLRY